MRERRSDSGDPELSPAGDPLRDCVEYASDCPTDGRGSNPSLFGLFGGVSSLALPSTLPQPEDTLSWRET